MSAIRMLKFWNSNLKIVGSISVGSVKNLKMVTLVLALIYNGLLLIT